MSYFSTDFGMLLFKADTFEQIIGTYFTSDPRWWWNPTTTICSMALSGSWSVMFTFQLIPSCCLLRDKLFKKTIFIKPPSWIRERVAWGRALLLVPRFLVSLNLNYAWNTYSTPWANLFLPEAPYPPLTTTMEIQVCFMVGTVLSHPPFDIDFTTAVSQWTLSLPRSFLSVIQFIWCYLRKFGIGLTSNP